MFINLSQAVAIGLLVVAVGFVVEGRYDPECHKDCSWKNWKNEIQSCSQNNSMGKLNDRSVCPNFFHPSIEAGQPDVPIQNVTIRHYSAKYTYPDGTVYPKTFTGLNISFDLDPAGFGLYEGAIIEIIGIKHQAMHFTQLGCFYLSFDGVLNSSAVILSNYKTKRIFFDCARQLAPGSTYLITIKMAPFTSKRFLVYYRIPSCFFSPRDVYCRIPEEEMSRVWSPKIFEVDVSGYREAALTFNLARPFDFDQYKVWLQEVTLEDGKQVYRGKREYCVDIYGKNNTVTSYSYCTGQSDNFTVTWSGTNTTTTIVTVTFMWVKPALYLIQLLPWPSKDSKLCYKGTADAQCFLTSSLPNQVSEDLFETPETGYDSKDKEPVGKGEVVAIIFGYVGCVVLVVFALVVYRSRQKRKQAIYGVEPDSCEDNDVIRVKRIFIVHSFDHPSHNNVVLKLCNFLSNCCKFDVHTALWSNNNIGKGVNEWITRECEVADKVIVLCSQGTQLKWRANYRDIPLLTKEEAYGDIFSIFLRVQRVEYEKNPEKFVVAYMGYSCEADIPQPLTFLMKYQLMDHMEQMYFYLNDMKKHSAKCDFNIPALHDWASATDVGVDFKKSIDEMKKKIERDEYWFFSYNEISWEIALRIKAKQQRILHPVNEKVQICSKPKENLYSCHSNVMQIILPEGQETEGDNISTISENEFQLANLESLKQLTGFHSIPAELTSAHVPAKFTSGHPNQPLFDSGISMSSDSSTNDHSHTSYKMEKSWKHEHRYLGLHENVV